MIKKLMKVLNENLGTIVTGITVSLTILVALIKWSAYVYWKGYLAYFNIEDKYIKMSNDYLIMKVVLYSIFIIAFILLMYGAYSIWVDGKSIKEYKGFSAKISVFFIKIIFSLIVLSIINIPFIILASMYNNFNLYERVYLFFLIYITELGILFLQRSKSNEEKKKRLKKEKTQCDREKNDENKENEEKSQGEVKEDNELKKENKNKLTILLNKYRNILFKGYILIIILMIITCYIYYVGNQNAISKSEYDIVTLDSNSYAIAYTSDENVILLACDTYDEEITIHKNIQIVMNINEHIIERDEFATVKVIED